MWTEGPDECAMLIVPDRLAAACHRTQEGRQWLERLPDAIRDVQGRWSLSLERPFDGPDVSCAWVAPAVRDDGTRVVLKLGMPHMEGLHELEGLRFWNGDPTVRLLEADAALNAMLLERCEPGTALRALAEDEQDVVVAGLLRRLWRRPPAEHPFRSLSVMTACWADETVAAASRWPDAGLVRFGLAPADRACGAGSRRRAAGDRSPRGECPAGAASAVARDRPETVRRRSGLRRDPASVQLPGTAPECSPRHGLPLCRPPRGQRRAGEAMDVRARSGRAPRDVVRREDDTGKGTGVSRGR